MQLTGNHLFKTVLQKQDRITFTLYWYIIRFSIRTER